MFKSIKRLIDTRLGRGIVIEDQSNEYGYFVKIHEHNLYTVVFFLKNDPDVKLALLDQIICFPRHFSIWEQGQNKNELGFEILYQLQSLKLPYRVSISIEINGDHKSLQSLTPLFFGARWQEEDISKRHGINIE